MMRRFVFLENFEFINLDHVVRVVRYDNNDVKIYLSTGEYFISKGNWKFLRSIVEKEIAQAEKDVKIMIIQILKRLYSKDNIQEDSIFFLYVLEVKDRIPLVLNSYKV